MPPAGKSSSTPAVPGGDVSRTAWLTLSFVCLACFFAGLSWAALNVAVPVVVRHFHAGPVPATWIVLVPQLANTAFMMSFGRLADVLGRRRLFLFGVGFFTIASLLCGLAPDVWLLVAAEVAQSIAGGAIIANSAAILIDAFPPERFNQVFGIYIGSFSIAELLGPSVGGIIADSLGWRWIYWLNVPVGVLCYLWGKRVLPRITGWSGDGLDIPGLILVPVALAGLVFALAQSEVWGWTDPAVLAALVAACVISLLFLLAERRLADPMIELKLFASRSFSLAMGSAFVNAMAQFSVVLLIALFFQGAHGDSALEAGIKVTPLSATNGLFALAAGILTRLGRPRGVALLGSALATAGIILLRLSIHDSYALTALALVLTGAGTGIFLPFNANVLMTGVPRSRAGVTNAVRITLQNIGALLCTAVCLTLITSALTGPVRRDFFAGDVSKLTPDLLPKLYGAYQNALTLIAVLAVIGTALAAASWLYGTAADSARPRADAVEPDPCAETQGE
jgi:EmrB/QacA subfamily drug resistance transporter